jgi:hypothetical protein
MGTEDVPEPVGRPRVLTVDSVARCAYCGTYGTLGRCSSCGAPNEPASGNTHGPGWYLESAVRAGVVTPNEARTLLPDWNVRVR